MKQEFRGNGGTVDRDQENKVNLFIEERFSNKTLKLKIHSNDYTDGIVVLNSKLWTNLAVYYSLNLISIN